jgi:hypothetical protein
MILWAARLGIGEPVQSSRNASGSSSTWIAVSVYVLVAIVRKRLRLEVSLYQLSTDFERDAF